MSIGNTPGYPGTTVSVPITVAKATNIVAAQFDFSFATNKVSAGAPTLAQTSGQQFVRSRQIAPGHRRVVAYSMASPLSTNRATIAKIPFTVAPDARDSSGPITPSAAILAKRDGTAATPLTLASGAVFIQPIFRQPDGTVNFFFASTPDKTYVIQATTNFVNWVNISTNIAFGNFTDIVDLDAPNYPYRFYRWVIFEQAGGGRIGVITLLSGGKISFDFTGTAGRTYTIQGSTNLIQWVNLHSAVATNGLIDFTDPNATNYPYRFYRVQLAN